MLNTHTQSTNTLSKVTANDTEESFNDRFIVYSYFCREGRGYGVFGFKPDVNISPAVPSHTHTVGVRMTH